MNNCLDNFTIQADPDDAILRCITCKNHHSYGMDSRMTLYCREDYNCLEKLCIHYVMEDLKA